MKNKPRVKYFYTCDQSGQLSIHSWDCESSAVHAGSRGATESFGIVAFIEKSAYDKAIEVHKKNAKEDYRGNRSNSSIRSCELLKELGELTCGFCDEPCGNDHCPTNRSE